MLRVILPQRRKDAKRCRVSKWPSWRLCTFAGKFLTFQKFPSVPAGAVGDFGAGEHTRDFLDATGFVETSHAHLRAAFRRFFLYDQLTVREARDLRLVGRGQHLVRLRKLLEL